MLFLLIASIITIQDIKWNIFEIIFVMYFGSIGVKMDTKASQKSLIGGFLWRLVVPTTGRDVIIIATLLTNINSLRNVLYLKEFYLQLLLNEVNYRSRYSS